MKYVFILLMCLSLPLLSSAQEGSTALTTTFQESYLMKTRVSGLLNKAAEDLINAELRQYGTGQNAPEKAANRIFQEDELLIEYNKNYILTYTVTQGSFRSKTAAMDMMNAYRQNWLAFSVSKNLKTGKDVSFDDLFRKDSRQALLKLVRKQLQEAYAGTPCSAHVFSDEEINKVLDKPCVYEEGIRFQSFACDKDKTNKALMEIYFSYPALKAYLNPSGLLKPQG